MNFGSVMIPLKWWRAAEALLFVSLMGCAPSQHDRFGNIPNAQNPSDAGAQYTLALQSAKKGDYMSAAAWLGK